MTDVGLGCPACGQVAPPQAAFCPYCGAALEAPSNDDVPETDQPHDPDAEADATVAVSLPPVSEAIGYYAGDKFGGAVGRLHRLVPRRPKVDNRTGGGLGLLAGGLAVAATYLPWIQIEIAGRAGPGSLATGLGGRDGVTVLVVGAMASLIGVVLLIGRGDAWLKMGLFVTGSITTIIGIVDIADVQNKAEALERRFGVREGVVTASVGIGLWVVLCAGVGLLAAGLLARRAVPVEPVPTSPVSPPESPG